MIPDKRRATPQDEQDADAELPPEAHNSSQDDADDQAQTLADEALSGQVLGEEDSERTPAAGTDVADEAGSTPDLIDHMKQMVSSGRIDMGAFRGERMDDDVEDGLGPQGLEDDSPRGAQ